MFIVIIYEPKLVYNFTIIVLKNFEIHEKRKMKSYKSRWKTTYSSEFVFLMNIRGSQFNNNF